MTYMKMSAGAMLEALGDDAQKWADAFRELHPEIDQEAMVGWFANAIEHSSDVRFWRLVKNPEAMADHIERLGRSRCTMRDVGLMPEAGPRSAFAKERTDAADELLFHGEA